MPHRPLVNLLAWQFRRSALPEGARTLQYTTISFDPSFLEVFLEIAPAMYIVPGLYLDLEAFLGVRFYF